MADTNAISTNKGRSIMLYRTNTANGSLSATEYLPLSQLRIGINGSIPTVSDTDLSTIVPISDGTVLDNGDNTLTGSGGGDNSTDNTSTYKEGAGETDATAQNLIANNTSVTKTWSISDLSSLGSNATSSSYTGLWFYIKDSTALAKFASSGTALEVRFGSDTSNYYGKTFEDGDLSVGWNWLSLGVLSANTETGSVASPIDTFVILVTTNNATDTFVAGDIVYDLARQWVDSDTRKDFVTGYPSINHTTLTVNRQGLLLVSEANGFLINNFSWGNEDSSPLTGAIALTGGDSKSSTDQWKITMKERLL